MSLRSSPAAPYTYRRAFRFKTDQIAEDGTFSGYGSVFGVLDSYGTIVMPGAFRETLARHKAAGTRPKLLWQHDPAYPIGSWTDVREDEHGLFCAGKLILEVEKAREAHALMKAGELDGLSIGFEVTQASDVYAEELPSLGVDIGDVQLEGPQIRLIELVELWEVSVVTFPSNAAATIETVRQTPTPRPDPAAIARLAAAVAHRNRLLRQVM